MGKNIAKFKAAQYFLGAFTEGITWCIRLESKWNTEGLTDAPNHILGSLFQGKVANKPLFCQLEQKSWLKIKIHSLLINMQLPNYLQDLYFAVLIPS